MIEIIQEQDVSPLGLTQWWALSKKYEAIISIDDSGCRLLFSDPLRRDIKNMEEVIYEFVIQQHGVTDLEYRFDPSPLEAHRIFFSTEKKIEILKMIDHIIAKNSMF